MKILRFLIVLMFSVVGTNVSAQKTATQPVIPDSLSIGTNFPAEGANIGIGIYDNGYLVG